ncbi:esterase E4 isoform X2 [Copidosoma floridanum]|uniref:esterase E4 isoform X2 n=1 Tax=Copidosoma floridanum TaxID=29053 RepID=UPI0006C991C6|nr:esterase E4 isoform X2 [Copidosoma floridanum]
MRVVSSAKYWHVRYFHSKQPKRFAMSEVLVDVKKGKLRGTVRENIDGGTYYSFRGIPFAEPPVGELRFKEPQPLQPWNGILDALEESKKSAQYDAIADLTEGGDDCLYLDVATNSLTEKRPVMVWIHGGGFKSSSNTYKKYSPDYLLKKNIVFVALNYRLGILGFLNMDHEECSGNQGLKDQIAGLAWVKENIEAFGGDSDNITVFGESAGGASVHALCLSPLARGLFQKAIIQSGAVSNPWAHISSNKDVGFSVAKALGKNCTSTLETILFLRTVPVVKLVETYETIHKGELQNLIMHLVPTLDTKSKNPCLPYPIGEMEKTGINVPLIIGYNSHEGIIRFFGDTSSFFEDLNQDFGKFLVDNLRLSDSKVVLSHAQSIREFYFGKSEINESKINEAVQFFGDLSFVANIHAVVHIQMQKAVPTYFYKFSYRPNFPGIKERMGIKIEGTCHADELGCLFFSELRRKKFDQGTRDRKAMERLTTMWTNFAKTSDPTPEINELIPTKWSPLEKNKKNYLEINDDLTSLENPDDKMWKLWKPLLESI